MRRFSIHSFKTGGWTPYIRRISGVSIPRPWKSSILISDTPAFVESAGSLPFDASTPLLSPVFAFTTAFDDEQEQSSDSTRNDTLYTTRYQPRESQILILLILILYNVRKPNQAIVMRPNPGPVSEIHVKAIEPQEEYPE